MRTVMFVHSLRSDWKHGSAHFLRGVATELLARGFEVAVYEPENAWSVQNRVFDRGEDALVAFHQAYPTLNRVRYDPFTLELGRALDGADLVLAHEWNDPALIARIGRHRAHRAASRASGGIARIGRHRAQSRETVLQ